MNQDSHINKTWNDDAAGALARRFWSLKSKVLALSSLILIAIVVSFSGISGERNDNGDQYQAAQCQNFRLQAPKSACQGAGGVVVPSFINVGILVHQKLSLEPKRAKDRKKIPALRHVSRVW